MCSEVILDISGKSRFQTHSPPGPAGPSAMLLEPPDIRSLKRSFGFTYQRQDKRPALELPPPPLGLDESTSLNFPTLPYLV